MNANYYCFFLFMASCQAHKDEYPRDPFQGALEEYPEIQHYVTQFQVDMKISDDRAVARRQMKNCIIVFKKKNLSLGSFKNIYDHNPANLELDAQDQQKSRSSCLRCRKFKKRCTRDLPECCNCMSCDELCMYLPRKRKRSSVSSAASETRSVSRSASYDQSLDSVKLPSIDHLVGDLHAQRRFSMPAELAPPNDHETDPNYSFKGNSDVYKLLN